MGGAAAGLPESLGPLRFVTEGRSFRPRASARRAWPRRAVGWWGSSSNPNPREMGQGCAGPRGGVAYWLLGVLGSRRHAASGCLYTRRQSRPLVTERKKGQKRCIRAPRALKPRLIIAHTPNNAAPRNKTARAAAPRAHRHDLRHDGISAVLNSARAAVEPRASLRTALPRPVARLSLIHI